MVSFREKFVRGLESRGFAVTSDLLDESCGAVLVIGGTRQLPGLWRARRRGARIVQRLDGMNWLHRRLWTGWKHRLRAEYGNLTLALIRSRLAEHVVYQSEFVRGWWERAHGTTRVPADVIYNGVDLDLFHPAERRAEKTGARLLMVEGSLLGGYEYGLEVAFRLLVEMARQSRSTKKHCLVDGIELVIAGRSDPQVQARWNEWLKGQETGVHAEADWLGVLPHKDIPALQRSAHLFFSSDINAACPNSVIEAMACGTPVIAFDTGAISELVGNRGGRVVPYGGDPWKLDPPDVPSLAKAALEVLDDLESFRSAARARAEERFDVNSMIDRYLQTLLGGN
jgi:glycosyltransferase involved in cell wall biosynthesis